MQHRPSRLERALLVSALIALVTAPTCAGRRSEVFEQADAAYEEGDYETARSLLEELDDRGKLDGVHLYRLSFAQRRTPAPSEPDATLERAIEGLEKERKKAKTLEVPYYLVSAYSTLERDDEARSLAEETTARIESGKVKVKAPIDKFRAGKLYADQGDDEAARGWLRKAVPALEGKEGGGSHGAIVWAARYLSEDAWNASDWSAAEQYLTILAEHEEPGVAELDRLATARVHNGMYREAGRAWQQSIAMDPGNSNRPRYCSRLAYAAARLKRSLPETTESGQTFADMGRAELEEFLRARATEVREIRREYAEGGTSLSSKDLKGLRDRLRKIHPPFLAAALAYALDGYNIREAAFHGGYAPLVFRPTEWRIENPNRVKKEGDPSKNAKKKTGGKRAKRLEAASEKR